MKRVCTSIFAFIWITTELSLLKTKLASGVRIFNSWYIWRAYFTWHVQGHRKTYLKWLYVRLPWETISLKIKSECIPACIMEYLTATLQSIRLSFGNDSLLIYKECKYVFIIPSLTWISEIGLILNWIKFWNQT